MATDQEKITSLLSQLANAGKRPTPQRHAVCRALVEHGGHPTVAEVYQRVRDIFPMMSQATVYNTIDTLEELGLIQRLDIANHEHTHYDLNPSAHVNLVCTRCGRIIDVHLESLDSLLQQVNQHTGYHIHTSASLVVYGTCSEQQPCSHRSHGSASPHAFQAHGHVNGHVNGHAHGRNGTTGQAVRRVRARKRQQQPNV